MGPIKENKTDHAHTLGRIRARNLFAFCASIVSSDQSLPLCDIEWPKLSAADRICAVGVGAPLSGPAAELGREMAQAIQLAVDEANAAQDVSGVRIEALIWDDRGDEAKGMA